MGIYSTRARDPATVYLLLLAIAYVHGSATIEHDAAHFHQVWSSVLSYDQQPRQFRHVGVNVYGV